MIKRIAALIIATLMIFASSLCAFAYDVPDYDRAGSITINLSYDGKPVHGGSLTIHKVGYVAEDDGDFFFRFTEDFEECEIPITELSSSELPKELEKIVKEKGLEGITKRVGSDGKVKFENLEFGLYLVVQKTASFGFSKINPFLVSVPAYDGEYYVYDVDASPKVELEPKPHEPEEPPEEPDKPDDKLPDTGLTNWPVPVMAVLGIILICTGIILRRAERKIK